MCGYPGHTEEATYIWCTSAVSFVFQQNSMAHLQLEFIMPLPTSQMWS